MLEVSMLVKGVTVTGNRQQDGLEFQDGHLDLQLSMEFKWGRSRVK